MMLGLQLLTLPVMALAILAGRSMARAYEDSLETQLPALTRWMLATPIWVLLIVFVLVVTGIIAKARFMKLNAASLAIDLVLSVVICLGAALLVLAMFLPMVAAYEDLSNLAQ